MIQKHSNGVNAKVYACLGSLGMSNISSRFPAVNSRFYNAWCSTVAVKPAQTYFAADHKSPVFHFLALVSGLVLKARR